MWIQPALWLVLQPPMMSAPDYSSERQGQDCPALSHATVATYLGFSGEARGRDGGHSEPSHRSKRRVERWGVPEGEEQRIRPGSAWPECSSGSDTHWLSDVDFVHAPSPV